MENIKETNLGYLIKNGKVIWDIIYMGYVFDNITFSKSDKNNKFKSESLHDSVVPLSDNDFYVIRCDGRDDYQFLRIRYLDGRATRLYEAPFNKYYGLSDDMLLLCERNELSGRNFYYFYSAEKNKDVKEFSWLSSGYDITPMRTEDGKVVLHVLKELESEQENDYIQFIVDTENFKPITEVHSTFSNTYIDAKTPEDVKNIIKETIVEKNIAEFYLSKVSEKCKEEAKAKLLSKTM